MFEKVLIANRGEIVGRIGRTLRKMGVASVAVYSDADRFARPVLECDEAVRLGPAPASESYLNIDALVAAAKHTGAQAVHPGYGFLSENVAFAERLAAEGIVFIGPRPEHLLAFGLKHRAREIARGCGVALAPGSGLLDSVKAALVEAERIGYPVMLKSTAGGGGIGMQLCEDAAALAEKFAAVRRTAQAGFGDARVYLERYVAQARHVEVQIFGDGRGGIVALGERDCSLQRRHQKVIEEAPAPHLPAALRARMHEAARALGRAVNYESAGTVEFIYDVARGDFYFLEVNTRLQVEHPVTEALYGVDLVEWMIRQAAGEDVLTGAESLIPHGAAMEARVYAENPGAGFRPSAGLLTEVVWPEGARVDGWIETGAEVTANYDPMLAKIIVHGETRDEALAKLKAALGQTRIFGVETNLAYLSAVAGGEAFGRGEVATHVLSRFAFQPRSLDVLSPGAQSTLQELPGRVGFWNVGVPPSGPMDTRSFRLANRIVGNHEDAVALEMTARGATLRFNADALFALAGARMKATLDGVEVVNHAPVAAKAGQVLAIGAVEGPGLRTYLALRGAFDAPVYLGSRATFTLGGFGGHGVGALKAGDVLRFADTPALAEPRAAEADEIPELTQDWRLAVVYGPHGAPDFFLDEDIETLFGAEYEVHFNSARTGVRLAGPKPKWARADGGEAGLHPSNIHDTPYALGAVDFTGDMPILLGPDGPSLGGFVCPAVTAREDMWKLGQLKPGDKLRFVRADKAGAIVGGRGDAVYRRAGDENLLVEYGPMTLDIGLRMRVHLLAEALRAAPPPGLIELTPGIRSLQVHYDSARLPRADLLARLGEIEGSLPAIDDIVLPSRIVHLPLSWDDPHAQLAMRKYQELVRPDAPWCPSNIEFIRRINGLDDEEQTRRLIFDASYLVLGLGDVYLGAPVATPLDPRHRLVTTKYNPARTWTPENAVGIGGAYMCVYGMEGPGGYQLFGRTVQMWNSWRTTPEFEPGSPWLLRFFDQIRFFPVSAEELEEARAAFPQGGYALEIEETQFSYADYKAFLAREAMGISAFKARQQTAFEAERQRWRDAKLDEAPQEETAAPSDDVVPEGCVGQFAEAPGNVWKVEATEGEAVEIGGVLIVIESMKMEIPIVANARGLVRALRVKPGQTLRAGDLICALEPTA